MKKTFLKRFLSAALAMIMLFVMSPAISAASDKDETVATVTIFCCVKMPGHCWIYVENLSDEAMQIGAYRLEAGEGVSVGSFGTTRYDGHGIYYNVEAYCQTTYGINNYRTLTEKLNREEVETLSNGIKSYNNNWNIFRNCVTFATKMWNLISDNKLSNLIIPAFTNLQMTFKGAQKNTPVQNPVAAEKVYRQKGNGDSAYLVNVSDKSLGNLW